MAGNFYGTPQCVFKLEKKKKPKKKKKKVPTAHNFFDAMMPVNS